MVAVIRTQQSVGTTHCTFSIQKSSIFLCHTLKDSADPREFEKDGIRSDYLKKLPCCGIKVALEFGGRR